MSFLHNYIISENFTLTLLNSAGTDLSQPGVFSVSIVFRAARRSVSVKGPSQMFCSSSLWIVSFSCPVKSERSILTGVRLLHLQRTTSRRTEIDIGGLGSTDSMWQSCSRLVLVGLWFPVYSVYFQDLENIWCFSPSLYHVTFDLQRIAPFFRNAIVFSSSTLQIVKLLKKIYRFRGW